MLQVNEKRRDWSGAYWVLLINQALVVGLVSLLGTAMLGESYRACKAASLYLPGFTEWYYTMGPAGLLTAGLVSVLVSSAAMALRGRFAGIAITTISFVSCIVFLAGGIYSSIAPLLVAVRDMLPPEAQW
jgi:hypothetical protein